jgi:predicted  nucleic acid-binding Zn-ribbon protein
MEESSDEGVGLAVLQSVRCLECGIVYAKPTRGGTAMVNPGCPECGYVGWVSATVPMRFGAEDQRPETRRTG